MDIETYAGTFDDAELVHLLARRDRNQIVLGRANKDFEHHPKPYSLCYWLRQRFGDSDLRLLTNDVLDALLKTGRYEFGIITDPINGNQVQGITLTEIARNGR